MAIAMAQRRWELGVFLHKKPCPFRTATMKVFVKVKRAERWMIMRPKLTTGFRGSFVRAMLKQYERVTG